MSLLLILCGYLMGSVPFAYLAGRLIRGIDIREYGTRSVGGSNAYEQVGRWLLVAVGLLDVSKAALPTWLALRLGMSMPTAVATGLAALTGHNWPLYLGFWGGRGLSTCAGVLVVVFPWGALWELAAMGVGRLLRHPFVNLLGLAALPLLAWVLREPPEVVASGAAMFLIVSLKRLEANREPLPPGRARWAVLKRRWLLDRDIEDWDAWITRRPEGAAPSRPIATGEHDQPPRGAD